MKHRNYYPSSQEEEPEWLTNFHTTLPSVADALELDSPTVAAIVADARWLIYIIGSWLSVARAFPEAATAAVKEARIGTGEDPQLLPVLVVPPLPAGDPLATPPIPAVVPQPPGALDRIFRVVKDIKNKPGYTETIGNDLRIIGDSATDPELPKFSLKVIQGAGCQCVEIRFFKYGRTGVYIESRRSTGGAWEFLAIATDSPYTDSRPLLVPGQPEVREYRLRFWDKGAPTGDWTATDSVPVAP